MEENKIVCDTSEALEYAGDIKKIAGDWKLTVEKINSANTDLANGINANIQLAFSEVIANNQNAFTCLEELLTSLGDTVEVAVNNINEVDDDTANAIRRKYGI